MILSDFTTPYDLRTGYHHVFFKNNNTGFFLNKLRKKGKWEVVAESYNVVTGRVETVSRFKGSRVNCLLYIIECLSSVKENQ